MIEGHSQVLTATIQCVWVMLGVSFALSCVRLALGPNLLDRVISLDLMSTIAIGLMAVEAIETGQVVFLIAAMVLALIMFLGTVAFALYINRGISK